MQLPMIEPYHFPRSCMQFVSCTPEQMIRIYHRLYAIRTNGNDR